MTGFFQKEIIENERIWEIIKNKFPILNCDALTEQI